MARPLQSVSETSFRLTTAGSPLPSTSSPRPPMQQMMIPPPQKLLVNPADQVSSSFRSTTPICSTSHLEYTRSQAEPPFASLKTRATRYGVEDPCTAGVNRRLGVMDCGSSLEAVHPYLDAAATSSADTRSQYDKVLPVGLCVYGPFFYAFWLALGGKIPPKSRICGDGRCA